MSQVLVSRPASQIGSVSKQPGVPNLPQIPHPLSRLGDPDKLNVRGLSSSSSHGRPKSNLSKFNPNKSGEIQFSNVTPRISRSSAGRNGVSGVSKSLPRIQAIPEGVAVIHTNDSKAKMPIFGSRADIASRAESRISMVSRSQSCSRRPSTQSRLEVEILQIMKKTVLSRSSELESYFHEIDENNSGKMSQETMYQLFRKLNITPEISLNEIKRVWGNFITTHNGFLNFQEFIRYFGYSVRSAAFPNSKISPPKRGDCDFLIRSRKLNCASDMLEDNLRSMINYRWDDLRQEFLELDSSGTGFISEEEFREVLQELCVNLNYYELEMLCKKFDINNDNRVSYVEFMKPFAEQKQAYKYANNMLSLLTHPQSEIPIAHIADDSHIALNGLTTRLRQSLVGDWRNLRRAFKRLDPNNSGFLTIQEFRQVLALCNLILTDDEVFYVMSEFDKKMEDKISYKRFLSEIFSQG